MRAAALLCALSLAAPASADVSLNSARVAAVDVQALANFYGAAMGLKEVNRLNLPGGNIEVMLNFGATVEAATANSNAQVVIMHRDADNADDPVPHLIFNVTDIDATIASVKAAGGSIERGPFEFGNTGIKIGFGIDPAGNRFEMIQQP